VIGARYDLADPTWFRGYMGELILFGAKLTDQQILDVNAYLGEKWGIAVAEGGDPDAGQALVATTQSGPRLAVAYDGTALDFTWDSRDGRVYDLLSATDLSAAPSTWNVHDDGVNPPYQDLAASGTGTNTLDDVPLDGTVRFFAIAERPAPPVTVVSEDFDAAAALPAGWSKEELDGLGNTVWEVGPPSTVGPTTDFGGAGNCAATNISDDYGESSETVLRTPPLDLTGYAGATLTFQQFVDIQDIGFDYGELRLLDSSGATLQVLESPIEGTTGVDTWVQVTKGLPAAAFEAANNPVKIEFYFESDNAFFYPGWYIDDVEVIANP